MKSCLSLLVALAIFLVFVGTAVVLWYTSSSTEFSKGADAETLGR